MNNMSPMCKILCISAATLFMVFAISACEAHPRRLIDEASARQRHEQWIVQHKKAYKNATEKEARFGIFKHNLELIESFNAAGGKGYKLSVNEFADMSNEEFKETRHGYKKPGARSATVSPFRYANLTEVPAAVDWRSSGAVTPVKNQGHCSSCWAFSAVAATEGITKLTTGKLISLSEQELLDCDETMYTQGCNGGYMEHAYDFIASNRGLTTEANYPYRGYVWLCDLIKEQSREATIRGHESVPISEDALMRAVAKQPVSVAVDTGGHPFQFYSSGVFTGECGIKLNHAVTVVGYGTSDDGVKYWLVKNSWGAGWGEQGYIRMQRGIAAKEGLCGIALYGSYPVV